MTTITDRCAARAGAGSSRPTSSRRPARQAPDELGDRATRADVALDGLRAWFLACLYADGELIGMPSKVVDVAWHEMILLTREYTCFCQRAFGAYLHHTPDSTLTISMDAILTDTLAVVDAHDLPMVLFTADEDAGLARRLRLVLHRPAPHARRLHAIDRARRKRRRTRPTPAPAATRRRRRRLRRPHGGGDGGCGGGSAAAEAEAGAAAAAAAEAARLKGSDPFRYKHAQRSSRRD